MTTSQSTEMPQEQEVSEANPKIYRSVPLRYRCGGFMFEKHELRLTSQEDVDKFEEAISYLSPVDRNNIRTIDIDAANALAIKHARARAHQGGQNSGVKPISEQTINHQNAEEQARAGMTPDEIAAAAISTGKPDTNFMPVEKVDTSDGNTPTPAPVAEPKPAAPAPGGNSLANLVKG